MLGGRENHAHAIAGRHRGSRPTSSPSDCRTGWTVTGYLFDRDYDPTRIPEGWTVDGILIDHDRPGNETLTLGNTFALFMV